MLNDFLLLLGFGALSFIQNAAFTWVSRSRNSGDPNYHRWASLCSNGIWFTVNVLIWKQTWNAIQSGNYWYLLVAGIVYVISTTEGSVIMMKILLKRETGKRKVGAS